MKSPTKEKRIFLSILNFNAFRIPTTTGDPYQLMSLCLLCLISSIGDTQLY